MRPVQLPFPSARILVVSDFNCPYCFTLNEWIERLGRSGQVRWVGIEHRPTLPLAGENSSEDAVLFSAEVTDVHKRAPELGRLTAKTWVNSNAAVLLQNAVEDEYPDLAPILRARIFRSYWREGLMISQDEVLRQICQEIGIPELETEKEYLEELTVWWADELDRIPCMLAPTGLSHLGLQSFSAVKSFLDAAIHYSSVGPGCRGTDGKT